MFRERSFLIAIIAFSILLFALLGWFVFRLTSLMIAFDISAIVIISILVGGVSNLLNSQKKVNSMKKTTKTQIALMIVGVFFLIGSLIVLFLPFNNVVSMSRNTGIVLTIVLGIIGMVFLAIGAYIHPDTH
ncbi:hypothetical protein [Tengunoibacter tsumagoiensis]|uniref:Uncharacterized protein n=1 Tax=Tengunoibacter tsumagoiensis TaxID=2014871 RepID=A0A401ZZ83_9CHLR|nr:hypothetical protein [Tengunoibacter tsumagoiensis]GCE12155.1 hypothetical protein KTT_20140 [Tengunoibacter tsumagoiensis]